MKMWGITNTGLVRSENQDAYAVFEAGAFHAAVVCDGMGGTNGGQVASAIAVARFEKELRDSLRDDMDIPQLRQAMLSAIACANDAIRQAAARNARRKRSRPAGIRSLLPSSPGSLPRRCCWWCCCSS